MKQFCLITILIYLSRPSLAFPITLTTTNDGICVAVAAWRTEASATTGFIANDPILFTDHLLCAPFSNIGAVRVDFPNRTFGLRIRMLGPSGEEIPKTSLGKQVGINFDNILTHPEGRSKKMYTIEASGKYDPRCDSLPGPILPSPKDWFQMEQPGIYLLLLEVQVFRPPRGSDETRDQLIRFPQIKLKVEMPKGALPTPAENENAPSASIAISILLAFAIAGSLWLLGGDRYRNFLVFKRK
jgi:hypothetical protein